MYRDHEVQKVRSETLPALERFVESVLHVDTRDWHTWALDLSRRIVDEDEDIVVRFPLFRSVLFPALLAAISDARPGAARWLAGFNQLIYKSPECSAQLPEENRTEIGLLRTALSHDDNDHLAQRKLVDALADQFEYAIHEVPFCVLWDNNGANISQCDELRMGLDEFFELADAVNMSTKYGELIDECRLHFDAYSKYLTDNKGASSYEDFLSHFQDA